MKKVISILIMGLVLTGCGRGQYSPESIENSLLLCNDRDGAKFILVGFNAFGSGNDSDITVICNDDSVFENVLYNKLLNKFSEEK